MVVVHSHCLIMLYICTMFLKNSSKGLRTNMICILKFTKGDNTLKTVGEATLLDFCTSADVMMLYICTNFLKLQTQTLGFSLGLLNFKKGHNFIKTVG